MFRLLRASRNERPLYRIVLERELELEPERERELEPERMSVLYIGSLWSWSRSGSGIWSR